MGQDIWTCDLDGFLRRQGHTVRPTVQRWISETQLQNSNCSDWSEELQLLSSIHKVGKKERKKVVVSTNSVQKL